MLYSNLLDPNLYDDPPIIRFIECLHEPEINTASDTVLSRLSENIMHTDDIHMLLDPLSEHGKSTIQTTGTLTPEFTIFLEKEHSIKLGIGMEIPRHRREVESFLYAGKALGFFRTAQCTFFSVMQPFENDVPISGKIVTEDNPWGLFIIGSSLRGNCFTSLFHIRKKGEHLVFEKGENRIMRDGEYNYHYSRFFHIENTSEMANIIKQMPKIMKKCNLSEYECIVNFATTLKALKKFGY